MWSHHPPLESLWKEHDYDGPPLGHGDRPVEVHRLQRLRGRLPGENNVPVVGKERGARGPRDALDPGRPLLRGRARRADPQRGPPAGGLPALRELAPCEQVCPVAATVHSDEGLNDMVYNRCVGTRYCANNCPYKVRRFNFFNYHKDLSRRPRSPRWMLQPRGDRPQPRRDGEVHLLRAADPGGARSTRRTRGAASRDGDDPHGLPAGLPRRGDRVRRPERPESQVGTAARGRAARYDMLAELNVKPRTTYLARIRNPNPEISWRPETTWHGRAAMHGQAEPIDG